MNWLRPLSSAADPDRSCHGPPAEPGPKSAKSSAPPWPPPARHPGRGHQNRPSCRDVLPEQARRKRRDLAAPVSSCSAGGKRAHHRRRAQRPRSARHRTCTGHKGDCCSEIGRDSSPSPTRVTAALDADRTWPGRPAVSTNAAIAAEHHFVHAAAHRRRPDSAHWRRPPSASCSTRSAPRMLRQCFRLAAQRSPPRRRSPTATALQALMPVHRGTPPTDDPDPDDDPNRYSRRRDRPARREKAAPTRSRRRRRRHRTVANQRNAVSTHRRPAHHVGAVTQARTQRVVNLRPVSTLARRRANRASAR